MNMIKDAPLNEHLASEQQELEQLRAALKTLASRFDSFEQHRDEDSAPLPPSYAQAMIALLAFYEREELPTLSDLVDHLSIDKSNVTRLCQRMQRANHLEVRQDERDRRAKRLSLTPRGVKLARRINGTSLVRMGELASQLSMSEREGLLEGLARVNALLERYA